MRPRWLAPDAYGLIRGVLVLGAVIAFSLGAWVVVWLIAEWMTR